MTDLGVYETWSWPTDAATGDTVTVRGIRYIYAHRYGWLDETSAYGRITASQGGDEVRITDPTTGGQKGQKPERYGLIPVWPLAEVARVYGFGASKYADRNWEKGYRWTLSYDALQRHINAFWSGEETDESGLHHLAHAAFHLFALMHYSREGVGTDDRTN